MSVDQGLRYELCALVARERVLEPLARAHPAARLVPLEQGMALVPVVPALTGPLVDVELDVPPETGFWALTPAVLHLVLQASATGPVAHLEADYVGHDGRQTAAVWECGELTVGPEILGRDEPFPRTGGGPIGAALRSLGVLAAGRRDEFVVLGLGRHRRTEDWC